MSDAGQMPEFPMVRGAEQYNDAQKQEVAEKAWSQSNGSALAFRQLCAEHVRGDIDLFAESGAAIKQGRTRAFGPGSDQYTASGGETIDRHVAAAAPLPASASAALSAGTAGDPATLEPPAPGSAGAEWIAPAGGTAADAGTVSNAGTVG